MYVIVNYYILLLEWIIAGKLSASEVISLWRYTNLSIIIVISAVLL